MATVTSLPGPQPEHRGLSHWMDRVVKELEHVRKDPATGTVHDLRVAIRRCRSVAAVMQEVDPDPAWRQMRSVPRKLFRKLGELRDAQVMDEWVKALAPSDDPLRAQLHAGFDSNESELRQRALRAAEKFDDKAWSRLDRKLRKRARFVPAGSLAAECLAVERFEEAKELHNRAQRTDKAKALHQLRIGLKRLRYTVENLLPEQYALWSDNLKRLQDLLGEVHDLDVLAETVKDTTPAGALDSRNAWEETIRRERSQRIETYRQLTLGKTSIWNDWRAGLPQGKRLAMASMARLRATARATDTRPRRSAQISRIAAAVFDALRRAHAASAFGERPMRRVLRAASRLHRVAGPRQTGFPCLRAGPLKNGSFWRGPSAITAEWNPAPTAGRSQNFPKTNKKMCARWPACCASLVPLENAASIAVLECARKSHSTPWYLTDSVENAARLAAGKHFLETYLGKALVLKPAPKADKVVALLAQFREHHQLSAAATASD